MKIINKGKYTNKIYKCLNPKCECEFEINGDDIYSEIVRDFDRVQIIEHLWIICPECKQERILYRRNENAENNN